MLKKLSITEDQEKLVRGLVSNKVSGLNIAKQLDIPQSTLWRNMELMGLNKKFLQRKKKKQKYFNWDDYKQFYKY